MIGMRTNIITSPNGPLKAEVDVILSWVPANALHLLMSACYYDNLPGQIEYGNMFHSFTFPDQAIREDEKGKLIVNFWNPVLQPGGIVKFIRPEECKSKKFIRNMPLTQFEIKTPDEITNLEKY